MFQSCSVKNCLSKNLSLNGRLPGSSGEGIYILILEVKCLAFFQGLSVCKIDWVGGPRLLCL